MDMVERYIYAICKDLPAKSRKDIGDELRSSIMDALEARTGGTPPADEDVAAVLKEFGPPSKVARNYSKAGAYLIGPGLYDIYIKVLRIIMILALMGTTVAFIADTIENQGTIVDFGIFVSELFSTFLSVIGSITLIFAIIERAHPEMEPARGKRNDDWDPKALPPVPQKYEHIKLPEIIAGLVFTAVLFVVFNYLPSFMGLVYRENGTDAFVSLVQSGALSPYLPYIDTVLCIFFIKALALLIRGRYNAASYIAEIIGSIGVVAIFAMLLKDQPLLYLSNLDSLHAGNVQNLKDILEAVYKGFLALGGVVSVYVLVKRIIRFTRYLRKA